MNKTEKPHLHKTDVSKSVFNRLYKSLNKNFSLYDSARGNIQDFLSDYVDFDFCVQNMAGDGFAILDYDSSKVAGLDHCFNIILKKGKLTKEDLARVSF
jgi:hypothetical protein